MYALTCLYHHLISMHVLQKLNWNLCGWLVDLWKLFYDKPVILNPTSAVSSLSQGMPRLSQVSSESWTWHISIQLPFIFHSILVEVYSNMCLIFMKIRDNFTLFGQSNHFVKATKVLPRAALVDNSGWVKIKCNACMHAVQWKTSWALITNLMVCSICFQLSAFDESWINVSLSWSWNAALVFDFFLCTHSISQYISNFN